MTSLFPDVSFQEAFPEVKSFRIEYEHTETRIEPLGVRNGVMTELNGNKELRCKWHRCKQGGFAIQQEILTPLVSKGETTGEGLIFCHGHEFLDKRNKPSCPNRLRYRVFIEYNDRKE